MVRKYANTTINAALYREKKPLSFVERLVRIGLEVLTDIFGEEYIVSFPAQPGSSVSSFLCLSSF